MTRSRHKTRMIMVGQLIHRNQAAWHRKVRTVLVHCIPETVGITDKLRLVLITVLLHTGQKPCHRFHKSIIVHNRIPLIAAKPRSGIPVMFRQDNRVRICCLDRLSEFFPEMMIKFRRKAQIRSHIQTPSVRIIRFRNPFCRNTHHIIKQFLRLFVIQFRQSLIPPPALIIAVVWPLSLLPELEKASVRAVRRHICPLFVAFCILIDAFPVHPLIERSAVVEHTIEDHLHSPSVRLRHHFGKQFIGRLKVRLVRHTIHIPGRQTILIRSLRQKLSHILHDPSKMRIDIIIILNVIFMIGR